MMKCFVDVKGVEIPYDTHKIISESYYRQGYISAIEAIVSEIFMGKDLKVLMEDLMKLREKMKKQELSEK